ncbi:MAG: DNA translocase FtsK 4TM domain-containing protein [Candidatus Latescibacteria bacterium]|nr:DNA translocase FtsK 4TM domain-containing protein [Candidatus Latescibacterota bacterium]
MASLVDKEQTSGRIAQALGVVLGALGIFLALSLISYSPQDFPNSSRDAGLNWGGRIGSRLSYWALLGIGYGAYVLPLVALSWAWNRLRRQPLADGVLRSAGLLGMALIFSLGAGLPTYGPHVAFKLGGWLGIQASNAVLIPYGGRIGSGILLGALFLAAMILTTDFVRVGAAGLEWGTRLWGDGRDWLGRRAEKKREEEEVEAEAEAGFEEEPALPPAPEPQFAAAAAAAVPEQRIKIAGPGDQEGRAAALPAAPEPEDPEPVAEVHRLPEVFEEPVPAVEPAPVPRPVAAERPRPSPRVVEPAPPKAPPAAAAPPTPGPRKKAAGKYKMPILDLLAEVPKEQGGIDREQLLENARVLEAALRDFDVAGRVVEVSPGPVVTRYEVEPAPGVKVNRIVVLADDLARVMSAKGIRIQAPVPGKSVVGVEIANQTRETVYMREILESAAFRKAESKLTIALGKNIVGEPYVADLTRMPHLLVAGATGAGKSVCINGLISSILFKATPEEVRLIMIDPKVVELTMYNDIPHLMVPVITEPKKAAEALKWAVAEMEARYQKLAKMGVRHLSDYNRKLAAKPPETVEGVEPEKAMPYIVIIIDEFADLMLTAPADVETSLMSLAQKSRAVGIHIVLATQRPSVNVITGVIKANFPSRIAFQVASKIDSRTILDSNGAERLLGRGDMLFLPGGQGEPVRVHGAFISGEETERIVEAIKANGYQAEEVAVFADPGEIGVGLQDRDELFDEAVRLVAEYQQASTSFLQRRMKVGYSRAARLMDELEQAGVVGPADGAKPRQIYVEGTGEDLGGDGAGADPR